MSNYERLLRVIVGGICVMVPSYLTIQPYLALALLIIGLVLIVTGLTGFCPVYYIAQRKAK